MNICCLFYADCELTFISIFSTSESLLISTNFGFLSNTGSFSTASCGSRLKYAIFHLVFCFWCILVINPIGFSVVDINRRADVGINKLMEAWKLRTARKRRKPDRRKASYREILLLKCEWKAFRKYQNNISLHQESFILLHSILIIYPAHSCHMSHSFPSTQSRSFASAYFLVAQYVTYSFLRSFVLFKLNLL